jgi:hypothetical protein
MKFVVTRHTPGRKKEEGDEEEGFDPNKGKIGESEENSGNDPKKYFLPLIVVSSSVFASIASIISSSPPLIR